MICYLLDVTYLAGLLFRRLAHNAPLQWDTSRQNPDFPSGSLLPSDRAEFVHVRLVAAHLRFIARVTYFPFIVLLVVILARLPVFDAWDWPKTLLTLVLIHAAVALFAGWWLYRGACSAAARATLRLRELAQLVKASGNALRAELLKDEADRIDARRDLYRPLAANPWLTAALLPSSGIGLLTLFEHLLYRL